MCVHLPQIENNDRTQETGSLKVAVEKSMSHNTEMRSYALSCCE